MQAEVIWIDTLSAEATLSLLFVSFLETGPISKETKCYQKEQIRSF